nr:MAG TPA: hypothetical protein [Caudoviricetes sp.]
MSSRLVDNISPALLAELDQASASMAAMVLIRHDGQTELVARDGHTPAELARALRNLALALQLAEDAAAPRAKRMRTTERAQKMRLVHCYITVAIRYMIEAKG